MKLIDGEKLRKQLEHDRTEMQDERHHFQEVYRDGFIAAVNGMLAGLALNKFAAPAPSESALRERIQKNIDEINERARTQPFSDAMGSAMFKDGLMWVLREMDALSSSPVAQGVSMFEGTGIKQESGVITTVAPDLSTLESHLGPMKAPTSPKEWKDEDQVGWYSAYGVDYPLVFKKLMPEVQAILRGKKP